MVTLFGSYPSLEIDSVDKRLTEALITSWDGQKIFKTQLQHSMESPKTSTNITRCFSSWTSQKGQFWTSQGWKKERWSPRLRVLERCHGHQNPGALRPVTASVGWMGPAAPKAHVALRVIADVVVPDDSVNVRFKTWRVKSHSIFWSHRCCTAHAYSDCNEILNAFIIYIYIYMYICVCMYVYRNRALQFISHIKPSHDRSTWWQSPLKSNRTTLNTWSIWKIWVVCSVPKILRDLLLESAWNYQDVQYQKAPAASRHRRSNARGQRGVAVQGPTARGEHEAPVAELLLPISAGWMKISKEKDGKKKKY